MTYSPLKPALMPAGIATEQLPQVEKFAFAEIVALAPHMDRLSIILPSHAMNAISWIFSCSACLIPRTACRIAG